MHDGCKRTSHGLSRPLLAEKCMMATVSGPNVQMEMVSPTHKCIMEMVLRKKNAWRQNTYFVYSCDRLTLFKKLNKLKKFFFIFIKIFCIEEIYFQIIFLICVALYIIFFLFILFNQFIICLYVFIIVWSNKKLILIRKFRKHNCVNVTFCEIKYLDLYMSFDFSSFSFESLFMVFSLINTHNSRFIWLNLCIKFLIFT